MSNEGQALIEKFAQLPEGEQVEVYHIIARRMVPANYDSLSDDDLTHIAGETFSLLDAEENNAKPG